MLTYSSSREKARQYRIKCHVCDGLGELDRFTMWGSEAYEAVKCERCFGDGNVLWSENEFRDEIAEIVDKHGDDAGECVQRILQHLKDCAIIPRGK